MKLGILDIGTNSIHLILVEIKKDLSVEVLDRAKEFARLGEGTFQNNLLSKAAVYRGISAIRRFKKLSEIRGITKLKAVATSAVREATNGGDFIDMIKKDTGVSVSVITGAEEARLIYLAVKHTIPLSEKPYLIVDIGGGSVELIVANVMKPFHEWSLKLGALRLKDNFIKKDPPQKKELQKIEKEIRETLAPILEKILKYKIETVIGTSGTILNLANIAHCQNNPNSIENFNNYRIKAGELIEITDRLFKSDSKSRLKMKGIDPQRNDMLISGSAVLTYLLKELAIKEVILCSEAIREGMVYDYVETHRGKLELEAQVPNIRLRSVLQLAKKCEYRESHAQHVSYLALSLFDQTRPLHQLGPYERELLHYAALLHDIGYHINYKKHHLHTYYLIKNGNLNGFDEKEIEMIANISRYHCKASPKKSHENWSRVPRQYRQVVKTLSSILRLADSLDRSHFSVVNQVQCQLNGKKVSLKIKARSDPELEIWAAQRKKSLFEKVFDKSVDFKFTSSHSLKGISHV